MNKTLLKKVSAGIVSGALALMSIPAVPAIAADDDTFKSGYTDDGYYWTIWNPWPEYSTADMTVGDWGEFEGSWSADRSEITLTVGKKAEAPFDWKNTWDQYWDDIYYDLEIQSDGISWYGSYGWFESPLTEYFIIEGYSEWVSNPGRQLGTYRSDGGTYELFYDPQIFNSGDLWAGDDDNIARIYAIRVGGSYDEKGTRAKGEISIKSHFEAWQELGVPNIDNVSEVSLGVYGWGSNGSVKVNENRINTRMEPLKPEPNDPDPAETDSPNCPDKEGYLFYNKFENGKGGYWGSTERSVISISDGVLTVSGRDDMDYVFRKLSPEEFESGKSYDFSVDVMQNEADEMQMDLYLQGFSGCMPVTVAHEYEDIKKGKWTTIRINAAVIPEDLNQLTLYIRPFNSTAGFSIDNAYGKISASTDIYDTDPTKTSGDGFWGDYYWYKNSSDVGMEMKVDKNGAFNCSWETLGNAEFSCGKKWASCPDWTEGGKMVYAYEMEYYPEGISSAEIRGHFKDIYTDAYTEFHICERWSGWDAPGIWTERYGTKTIDGVDYEIYRGELPSFDTPNNVFWSIRKDGGEAYGEYSGTVTLSEHFAAYEELSGMKLGGLGSALLNITGTGESKFVGLKSSGTARITKNELTSCDLVDLGEPEISDWDKNRGEGVKDGTYWYKSVGGKGKAKMLIYDNGCFSTKWEKAEAVQCYVGMGPEECLDRTMTDSIVMEYEAKCDLDDNAWFGVTGNVTNGNGGLNYVVNIAEVYGSEKIIGENFEYLGDITADGNEYGVYIVKPDEDDVSAPYTPIQIWSVRKDGAGADGKYSGTVTVSDHLAEWDKFSEISLGDLVNCMLAVSGADTSGEIMVTKNELIKTPDIPNARLGNGDANCDGKLTIADAAAIIQYLGNSDKYALSTGGKINADFDGDPGITTADAVAIQKALIK